MYNVYVSSAVSYDVNELNVLIEKQFSTLNIDIKKGSTVVLKPNLVIKSKAEEAIITHPNVTAAVGNYVKKRGGKVLIAESPGGLYTPPIMKSIFDACGYTEMADEHGFSLYTECEFSEKDHVIGEKVKKFEIVKPFLEADLIINIAKLKSHGMLNYSGASKNLFGTVPGLKKPEFHMRFQSVQDFSTMLVDLNMCHGKVVSVIDGITAMEGDGPTGGRPTDIGVLISSDSQFAADFIGTQIVNMNPHKLPLLKIAMDKKVCPTKIEEINLYGDDYKKLVKKDFLMPKSKPLDFSNKIPKCFLPLVKKIMTPYPKIKHKNCVGCGKCKESCPANVITIVNKKAYINNKNCIKCFCCHEMCPFKVVDIKRFSLFKF